MTLAEANRCIHVLELALDWMWEQLPVTDKASQEAIKAGKYRGKGSSQ